jgi:hypothetical protein
VLSWFSFRTRAQWLAVMTILPALVAVVLALVVPWIVRALG